MCVVSVCGVYVFYWILVFVRVYLLRLCLYSASSECYVCIPGVCSVFRQREIERRPLRTQRHFGYADVMKLHKQLVLKCTCLHTFLFALKFDLRVSDIKVLWRLLRPKKRKKWRGG
jgi:hypothetical protein